MIGLFFRIFVWIGVQWPTACACFHLIRIFKTYFLLSINGTLAWTRWKFVENVNVQYYIHVIIGKKQVLCSV